MIRPADFAELASSALRNQKSTSTIVADTIRSAILRGQFKPGRLMPQEELAKQFHISRAPIRDALRKLETEGLIVLHPHGGAEVVSLSASELTEVFLIRESLETTALRLSVPRMREEHFCKSSAVLDRIDEDDVQAHMAELNWEFHESLYLASEAPRLLAMVRTLNNNALPYHHLGFLDMDIKEVSQQGHRAILSACRAYDTEAAVRALIDHLRVSRSLIVDRLENQAGVTQPQAGE